MAQIYGPHIVTDGLVLALDAASVNSYPGSGTTWFDMSGNGNNATLYNSPTWNSAGYFTFDGTNDYAGITFNSATMAAWALGQTIIVWEYHSFNDGSRRNIWNQAYGGYGTWTHEGGYSINYFWGDAGVDNLPYTSINSSTTPINVWNMLVTSRDASNAYWYVNGVNTSSGANPYAELTATTANISIGIGYTGTYWVGNMAVIMAYNRALTSAEILQNYNAQKSRFNL